MELASGGDGEIAIQLHNDPLASGGDGEIAIQLYSSRRRGRYTGGDERDDPLASQGMGRRYLGWIRLSGTWGEA